MSAVRVRVDHALCTRPGSVLDGAQERSSGGRAGLRTFRLRRARRCRRARLPASPPETTVYLAPAPAAIRNVERLRPHRPVVQDEPDLGGPAHVLRLPALTLRGGTQGSGKVSRRVGLCVSWSAVVRWVGCSSRRGVWLRGRRWWRRRVGGG